MRLAQTAARPLMASTGRFSIRGGQHISRFGSEQTWWIRAAVVGVLLTAAAALVAIASRAPLSGARLVNDASARAPAAALFLVLAGAAVVAVGAVVIVLVPGRRGKNREPEPVPEPPPVHWIWKALAVTVPLALGTALVAAAVIGTRTSQPHPRLGGGVSLSPGRASLPRHGGQIQFALPSWLPWTVLAVVAVATLIAGLLVTLGRVRQRGEGCHATATRDSIDAAIGALAVPGDPRAAVIAAYAAMEETLADHGLARPAAEAPREYLRRVLAATPASGADAATLTGLFEEARFSTHRLPERVRERALAALRALRAGLAAGAVP